MPSLPQLLTLIERLTMDAEGREAAQKLCEDVKAEHTELVTALRDLHAESHWMGSAANLEWVAPVIERIEAVLAKHS